MTLMKHFQDTGPGIEYDLHLVNSEESFNMLMPRMAAATALAIDIETINWWNRDEEKISIVQIGFREDARIVVAIVDTLGSLSPQILRHPFELGLQVKVMHNASFDAVKLEQHFGIRTSPVHDTMRAAQRNGEKGCSLKALVDRHFGYIIDKTEQRGDWSVRPLRHEQLRYAALDVVFTLLLYEMQTAKGLYGDYSLKASAPLRQIVLSDPVPATPITNIGSRTDEVLSALARAIIQIVEQMPGRFSTRFLALTISSERAGLTGWILDRTIGLDIIPTYSISTEQIDHLLALGMIKVNENGRLEPGRHVSADE